MKGAAWRRGADILVAWRKRRREAEEALPRRRTRSREQQAGLSTRSCAASLSPFMDGRNGRLGF
jgi:hypothetical protein